MDMRAASIALQGVDKRFASGLQALAGVNLEIAAGSFVALVGPSGCGKSSVLRLVAGLDAPTAGQVNAPAVADPASPATAYVFQDATLMPWASVFDNVWLPLRLAGTARAAAERPVRDVLASVGLGEFVNAYPAELSGGMRMRVSLARALVTHPRLLLMDEPFAALDEITRGRLNADLLEWWQARGLTVLFVTHSVYESVFLSQRVLVMSSRPGRIVAEVPIEAPYPRDPSFRESRIYLDACRRVSAALESA
jgi:NitT/TauT family transport system ATP-binding protein